MTELVFVNDVIFFTQQGKTGLPGFPGSNGIPVSITCFFFCQTHWSFGSYCKVDKS